MSLGVTFMVTTPEGIKKLHLLEIQNDRTGTEEIGNYNVRLRSPHEITAECRVENFPRKNGVLWLAKWAIEELSAKKNRERWEYGE